MNIKLTVLAVSILAVLATGCASSQSTEKKITHPLTAAQIAQQHGATDFVDHGTASSVGVTSSGVFHLKGVKYGVDTFDTQKDRDKWMQLTEAVFGMKPVWLTPTSVVYRVVHIPEA